jgi:hypothetical protein
MLLCWEKINGQLKRMYTWWNVADNWNWRVMTNMAEYRGGGSFRSYKSIGRYISA